MDGQKYSHVPIDFYLKHGILKKSSKNNYYVELDGGTIIIIPQKKLNGATTNDTVFVDIRKSPKHKKQLIGNVVRVVSAPKLMDKTLFFKARIKRDTVKNYYYVEFGSKVVYIHVKDLNGAFLNDLATIHITDGEKNYGRVLEIILRDHARHVLEYKVKNEVPFWSSVESPKRQVSIKLDTDCKFNIGDKILVELDEKNNAKFLKKLDVSNDMRNKIKNLLYDTGYQIDSSENSIEEIKQIKTTIDSDDLIGRRDLRSLLTVTMDKDTAKDLDDAISLEYKDHKWYLYVHIADVSNYVKYKSGVFYDALNRGTSVYAANSVFHMLNDTLADGVCSLNEGEDKLTKTCLMVLDETGEILEYSVFNSIINSDKKMSYSKVNDFLNYGVINEDYKPFLNLLKNMKFLSDKLQLKKIERGYICFEDTKIEFDFDENNTVKGILDGTRGPAELIIENFMLSANNSIANIAECYGVPFLFRNHNSPSIDQLYKIKETLKALGIHISTLNNATSSRILQRVLLNILKSKSEEEKIYISRILLRFMSRAYYDVNSTGHYALAYNNYATFSSPIRKFPDLLNHYILDKIIKGDISGLDEYYSDYLKWKNNCNSMRLLADNFEKYVDQILLSDYLNQFIGQTLSGVIVFINYDIVCIKVNNSFYGSIKVSKENIKNDCVTFYDKKYREGSPISVKVDLVEETTREVILSVVDKKEKIKKRGTI